MSSESEDEFQSADEGSDLEDLECNPASSVHPQPLSVYAALCERTHEIEKDETHSEAVEERLSKDISNVAIAVDTGKNNTDTCEKTETLKESEKSLPVDVLCIFKDKSDHENIEERAVNQLEVNKCSEGSITQEVGERGLCIEELQKERIKPEKNKEEFLPKELRSDVETDEAQPKNVTEDLEEKFGNTKSRLEALPSQTTSLEIVKVENTAAEIEVLAANTKSKPIRQSKIGMKKPREKLGERLGARKLGTKVASKPIDSISSSDTIKHKAEEDRNMSTNERGSQSIVKDSGEDRGEEDEKIKKRQQWEEQQERWHQALNLDRDKKETSSGSGDGWSTSWGGWGDTLLSAATTFTREVGRGVGTVMETVESNIGVPSPEVMAQEVCKQDQRKVLEESTLPQDAEEEDETEVEKQGGSDEGSMGGSGSRQQLGANYGLGGFSLGSLVSGVSGALETASSKVLMGGLDTLEVIGRKAMDVIQEGDPGLHRKRAFLSNKKPNLSQTLQEARQRAAEEERDNVLHGGNSKNLQKFSFEQAWETTEGPVHLEALSLVAKQCQGKQASMMATIPHYAQDKLTSENTVIKTACELEESAQLEEDLAEVVSTVLVKMGLPLQSQKLIEAWSSMQAKATFIQEAEFEETNQIEAVLYGSMAQFVAQLCALAHKGGELALITPKTEPLDLASHFKDLAQAVSSSLENVADQVCGAITSEGSVADAQMNTTITNIYLQAASGNKYIQQSLVLLASVLQYSNTKLAAAHH